MTDFFDAFETESADARADRQFGQLKAQVAFAKAKAPYFQNSLADVDPDGLKDASALAALPLVRKSDLLEKQKATPPRPATMSAARIVAACCATATWPSR